MALAHDEKPRPSVRRELDLEAGSGAHRLHALACGPENHVVDAPEGRGRMPEVDVAIAAGEARVGNVLADDFRGVPAVPDEMGEAGEQESRKDERGEQEALEHVRGEVYVRALTVVPTFVCLAKDFTARYPVGSEKKRLIDAMLLA